jgi:hypothetical protein
MREHLQNINRSHLILLLLQSFAGHVFIMFHSDVLFLQHSNFIDEQVHLVRLVRLQAANFRLFLREQTNKQ